MAKIAITLPDEVLDAVEKERAASGISRSEYIRRTVEEHLLQKIAREIAQEKEKEDVARYIQGYLENPETPESIVWVQAAIPYAIGDESWEDEYNKSSE